MRIDTCGRASDEHYTRRCNGNHRQPATARGRPMYKRPSETADSDLMGSSANTGTPHCQGESRRSKRPPYELGVLLGRMRRTRTFETAVSRIVSVSPGTMALLRYPTVGDRSARGTTCLLYSPCVLQQLRARHPSQNCVLVVGQRTP